MLHVGIKRTRVKILYVAAAALIIGGAFSTYAQLSSQAYTVRTVHVFPAEIKATGFENAETLTFQNLDEFALLQDFNAINSATLIDGFTDEKSPQELNQEVSELIEATAEQQSGSQPEIEIISVDRSTSSTQTEAATSSQTTGVEAEEEPIEAQAVITDPASVDEAEAASQNSIEEPSAPAPDPVPAAGGTTTVSRLVDRMFVLAIDTLTETFSSTSATSTTEEETEREAPVIDEPATTSSAVVFSLATTSATSSQEEAAEPEAEEAIPSTTTEPDAVTEVPEAVTTSTPDVVSTGTQASSTDGAPTTTSAAVSCEPTCTGHVIELQNFGFPLEEGTELSGAQLRLSFAAKHKASRSDIPSLTVNYSLDDGVTWSTGGSIVIDDEVSNSINGGYYLFALPAITDQTLLENLQVEIRYDADPALVEELFVESVWLELFVLEPPEDLIETPLAELLADDGYTDSKLSGDTLVLPDGEEIHFSFTDNNDGETLIVKSDRKTYEGLSEATTYFSVTNESDQADEFSVQTYFPRELGEVTKLEVFNLNKPREALIPEYRPYVYHCEAGWQTTAVAAAPASLESLSITAAATTSASSTNEQPTVPITTSSSSVVEVETAASSTDEVESATTTPQFSCQQTSVVRACEVIEGDGTACVITEKVKDHQMTKYAPGWDTVSTNLGAAGRGGLLQRVGSFFGFGPKRKDIPASFEAEVFTGETFTIAPGETRYFKMDIAFPPFTTGEYWIEVVGDSEYGLLDPFWNSEWQYRMPLQITNPTASAQTEFQVKLDFDSSMTDFWANVDANGDDIRFVQEVTAGNFSNEATAINNWVDLDFSHRVPIEIPAGVVDEDLTNFPISLDLSSLGTEFWNNVRSDGGDIRVYDSAGTEVAIDLAYFNNAAQRGELHFLAATVPAQSATTYYVYYGDSTLTGYAATDPLGAQAVWVNYNAVYHFTDDPSTVGNIITDETGNGYDLEVFGAGLGTTTGQFGVAIDIGAGAGYLATTTWTFPGGDPLIVTGSYQQPAADGESLFQWGTGAQPNQIQWQPWYTSNQGRWTFGNTTGDEYTNLVNAATSSWHGFGLIGTTSVTDNNYVYEDGVLVQTQAQNIANASNTNTTGFEVGRLGGGGSWNGLVDELRIATGTRSQARVKAESLALEAPEQVYNLLAIQTPDNAATRNWYSTSWEGRQRITIPSSRVDGDQTEFPVYLDLSLLGADFFNRVASDGRDIRITLGDGVTEIPHELVTINTSTDTGELYFKADLNDASANEFYIYFDNEDAEAYDRSDTYGSENVWTNNFQAVYHLQESATGIGNPNVYLDSTANQYHGDDENASDGKIGLFGAGQEFGDTQDDRLSLPREVLNGLSVITTSWWHQTTNTGQQTIVSAAKDNTGAGANEYILWFNADTNFQIYLENGAESFALSDTIGDHTGGAWNYFVSTADAGNVNNEVNFYVNGVGDTENPDPQNFTDIEVANGGLIVGQEQDSLGAGFSATQNFEGNLDELRFADVVRDPSWIRTEYENMGNPSTFISTSSSETLQATEFVELDYWLVDFDSVGDTAEIWVQVENLPVGDSIIYVYYGNAGAPAASNELETFSYDTLTETYYVVDNSSANTIAVVSLADNNQVQLDGGTIVDLNRGERTTFTTFGPTSALSVLAPVSAAVVNNSGDSTDILAPIAFASTSFAVPTNRSTSIYYAYAPFASTTINSYIGNSGTPDETNSIGTSTAVTINTDAGATGVVFEATSPILLAHRSTNPGDGLIAYEPTTDDVYGVLSNTVYMTALADDPDPTRYCSGGYSGTDTGILRGDADTMSEPGGCSQGNESTGDAVRFTGAATPFMAIQQADSDGNESTMFWPEVEFGTQYAFANSAAYAAIVCSPNYGPVGLEVQDELGNTIETGSCVPGVNTPGKAYFDNGSGDGDGLNFTAGSMVIATNSVPFYMIWEDVSIDQDEKNTLGTLQARKFGAGSVTFQAGPQEEANGPQYEQLSFSWYQNGDVLTPTTTWSLGSSEFVSEGEAITGAGAVDNGDILRLRMNVVGGNATATAGTEAFILQYAPGTSGQCSAVTTWYPLGEVGSTTATFAGYNNANVSDGTTLATTTLASSTLLGTYEERNFSDFNPVDLGPGQVMEWDWAITAVNVSVNQNYCFRMIRAIGEEFPTYTSYPELETVGPPNVPIPISFFDNEHTPNLAPVLEFVASDIAGDDIHYEVQIDDDVNFGSIDLTRNSDTHFLQFTNINSPADKAPFTSGAQVRFTATTDLASSTTYWWRVRASDPGGSATSSDWSTPYSFTTNQTVAVSEWFQTTTDQFETNSLVSLSTSTGQVNLVGASGVMTGTGVDFDDATVGNAWGEVDWNSTETSGTTTIQIQYNDNGNWQLIPDTDLPGNLAGFTTGPINILELDTSTYNEIRLVATLTGTTVSLQDWTVRWGLRVEIPTQGDLFDNQKTANTLPVFDFFSTDPQGDDLEYEISFSTDFTFESSSSTFNSGSDVGFANLNNGGDTSPFTSGDTITYTTQSAFTGGVTYWWRTRAKDPAGGDAWSPWSTPDAFTIDASTTLSTWFQTTRDQFNQGELSGTTASTSGSVVVSEDIGEYGRITLTNNAWTTINTTLEYRDMVVVASPEFNFNGTNNGRTVRVRNKGEDSFEIKVDNYLDSFTGSTEVDYIVMEAGDWTIDDGAGGFRILAATQPNVTEKQSDSYNNATGVDITLSPAFSTAPIALATVSSDNDSNWVGSHLDGGGAFANSVTTSNIRLALTVSRHTTSAHTGGEDIDYLVIEPGNGTIDGTNFHAFDTGDSITDAESADTLIGFTVEPAVTVVHVNGDDGAQGGFAQKDLGTAGNNTTIYTSISEQGASADGHTTTNVSVFAIEDASGLIKRDITSGSIVSTIAGEDIIFSDGAGPKFDNFSWNDTTPATSDVTYQIQYRVSDGVYALIPDSALPGNSTGFTTSPIDLTSIDINTYDQIRPFATLSCGGGSCPSINDWQLEWSEGVNMSGTLQEYDRTTAVATGTIRAAVNGVPVAGSGSVSAGVWTLSNVTAFAGDIVTVWVDGAAEAEEAVTAFVYDGTGDITGVKLYEQHLAFDADEKGTITNALLASYDNGASGDEDIFFDVDGLNNLTVCAVGTCPDANLYVGSGQTYIPATSTTVTVSTHDFINNGSIELDSNVFNVSGSWDNNATSSTDTSTVNMTAATGTESISSTESPLDFHNVSFGGFGVATFTISVPLDLSGNLTVATGTLARDGFDISVAGNLTTEFGGVWNGTATTTFDATGAATWRDNNPTPQNIGNVIVDGAGTILTIDSDVAAYDITIGSNDTLVGGTANTIYVGGDWTNNGLFTAGTSIVEIVNDDRSYPPIVPGSSDWYSDTNFDKRVSVVVDSGEVPGQLTNFPVYVDLSTLGNDFWNDVATDGRDIRVTAGDGQTELPHDLVEINTTAKTGELHLLANNVSSTADTTFYIYFDNPLASAYASDAPYGSEAVWAEYVAVYHFAADPTFIGASIPDETGNGYTLQVEVAALSTTTGQLGTGLDFNGSAGLLRDSDFTWPSGDPLTTSGWYFMTAASNEAFWEWGTGAQPDNIDFRPWYTTTNGLHYFGATGGATYSINPRDTTNWHHFVTLGATSTSQDNVVYEDAIEVERVAQTVANPTNTDVNGLQVGREGTGGSINAIFDEFRIATVTRNTDWVEAEYTNQFSPTIFYSTTSAESYTAPIVLDEATHVITAGGSAFYTLRLNDATTSAQFADASVAVNDDFIVATGSIALPTGILTIGGSLLNSGYIMHNNGEIEFTSNGAETIQLQGTEFLNYLFDVTFDGSGTWTFTDANATTSGFIDIQDGTVVFPTGVLTIGDTLNVQTGGAAFDNASGTVHFISANSENIRTAGSPFNNVVFGDGAFGWYDENWSHRIAITVDEAALSGSLTDYPMYINLAGLSSDFWNNVQNDGRDIRVTTANGETEVATELVSINKAAQTGEFYFLAPTLSDISSTTFYIYIGNAAATAYAADDPYGAENVWVNYEAVYHFEGDPATGVTDVSGNGKDLSATVGTPATTTGILGQAVDMTAGNTMLADADWTWTAGEDLISSGLYFQSALDTGALWQFGTSCVADTCIAFLPWYDNGGVGDRGYHRFGEITGSDYGFPRDNAVWHHFTTIGRATDGERSEIYEDNILRDSMLQTSSGQNPTQTGLQIGRYTTGTYMDIDIDELRFATTAPSEAWVDFEYKNLRSTQTLYSQNTELFLGSVTSFTLNEAITTATGDVTLQGARLVAPSNTFFIGGSALNTAGVYDPNNATTTFNSTDLGESFDFGDVSFYNLAFDGVGGGWTVSTTTVINNLTLANGASYTQATSTTMTVGGRFSNQFSAAATDWTTSTLVLTGGDYTVTDRTDSGDDYAIIRVSNDTDIVIWNSTISTSSVLDSSSIYMPDFGGVDGQLNIYGDYERVSGAEHWSYATDFDGTSLTGGSERQANVYFEGGASVTLGTSTTLNIVGVDGATSTLQALFGIYSLELRAATLNATRFSMIDAAPTGLELRNGTIVSNLSQADFLVAPGRTAITVDAATINAQPSTGFSTVNFATTSASTIYKSAWSEQLLFTVHASSVEQTLTDFPVYVDLSELGPTFWAGVRSDGGDIRVTTELGRELPIDMVEINPSAETGELHFLAPSLSATEDTDFYIHYNNPSATAYANSDQYGANAVWAQYEAVYHFNEDPATGITDVSGNGRDLVTAIGVAATTSGEIGTALDTTGSDVMLADADWTWQAGDDLISSGLYFQSAFDTGALWQFGSTCGTDDCIAFMPWYDNATRGYHRFGETSGNDYNFARNNTIWHHFTTIGRATDGELVEIYEDDVQRDTYAQTSTGQNPSLTGLQIGRYTTGTYMDIDIDELRITTIVPSDSWRKAEYNNLINPAGFAATSSGPTETFNVTTDGVPTTFWSFSNGTGGIYGEAFDNDDGDPGSIQWDDSDFTITVSGTVYSDDGVTPESAPVCNGSTEVVTVVIGGVTTYRTSCDPNDGSYEVTGITYSGEPKITAYVASDAPTTQVNAGVADTVTGNGTIAGGVITLSRPVVQDGTVLLAIFGKDDDLIVSPPAGWVALDTLGNTTGDNMFTGAWYRVVSNAGTEPATYNFTSTDNGEGYSYWMGALVNVDNVTPVDVASTWIKYQNDATPAAPSVTTVTNGAVAIAAWYGYRDTDLTLPDTSWKTQVEDLATPEGDSLSVQSKLIGTAGATGVVYANNLENTRESQAAQFVFRPAGSVSATSSITAAAVTKTPIGSGGSAYKTIGIRDQRTDATTTPAAGTIYVEAPRTEDGDVLVAIIGKEDDLGITAPAGWIKAADRAELVGSQMYSGIWYKVISNAAGEPNSYSFINDDTTAEEVSYWIGSFDNVDTNTVFDVTPTWSNLQNTSAPTAPSITTVTPGAYVLAAWNVMFDNSVTMPGGPWATLAEDIHVADRALNVAGRRFTSAGATGGVTITDASTDDVNVGQFALRPAPASVAEGIFDLDLYQNRVIVRHEDISPLSIADMNTYDSGQNADLPFTASTSTSPDSLTVLAGSGLYVWGGKTFAPDGTVTLAGAGSSTVDGSLTLGPSATYTSTSTNQITIGGSFYVGTGATFTGAQSLLSFTAATSGQQIGSAASSTINIYDLEFTGAGGWAVQTPIIVNQDIFAQSGTVSGVGNITVTTGDFYGNGTVAMTGGTTLIATSNTFGGTTPWSFRNLTLGNGVTSGTTVPASTATTTITNQLRINSGHFLDAGSSTWDLAGSGTVFVENGTFLEDTSTVRYSGATPSILRTAYHNLVIDTESGGSVTATAPTTGLQVLGDLTVGALGTSTLNLNTNDPLTAVGGDVYIGTLGTIEASNTNTIDAFGDWDNDGTFNANGGLVEFVLATGTATIAAGNSPFANLTIAGNANYTVTESATTTEDLNLGTGSFTLQSGETLAVGGTFTNGMDDVDTTWTGTTLRLFGGQAYTINTKATGDTYNTIAISASTHPRFWNSDAATITTEAGSSLYSMDHADVTGDLYIFGDFVGAGFNDHWSYAQDWDGASLGVPRIANVQIEDGGTVTYVGGSLTVLGSSTASTSIAAQGAGPYTLTIGGTTTVDMNYYTVREISSAGLILTGSPDVVDLSFGDFEPASGGASGITVGGTVINVNQAQNFTNNRFATTTAIAGVNVTATGTAVSSWRFVNVDGNLDGEQFDVDPGGDPGYIVWQDSAAIIDISGTVFQSDRTSTSTVCDGTTNNIRLSIGGLTFASTSCSATTGQFVFNGIGFGPSDTLTVYIDGEAVRAANVTKDPISLINNMDLYENHVILRHESTGPMTIAAMAVYDSSDDVDIPFTAVDAGTDTLTLNNNFALVIWNDKTFAPGGSVSVPGGGAGASYDGTVELFTDATWDAASGQSHTIGGNLISGTNATFDADLSTTTFTSSAAGRTIDTNDSGFHNLAFTGSGSWTILDTEGDINNDFIITAGTVTLPAATTTITGSFTNSGGAFVASGGTLVFDATDTGNDVTFGGSDAHQVLFSGAGGAWSFSDTNATTTASFVVATGSVTLPSGILTVTDDFIVNDTIAHAGGEVRVIGTAGGNVVTLSGNDLSSLTIDAPAGDYTLTDASAALLDSLTIIAGTFTSGSGTVSIGGSFDASGGVFNNASGTLLFNSTDGGEFIDPGANDLHNLIISGTGGWNLADNATTTNNFSLLNAGTFTVTASSVVYVGGVFTNNVGGAATTWTNTTLVLDGMNEYETGSKSTAAEVYGTLILGENTDISSWNSSAATTTVPATASWYSQDHAGVDGDLYIFGDYHIATTTEYWSAATDFDGTILGTGRAVSVAVASGSTITLENNGTLYIIGTVGSATTSIDTQGSGTFTWTATGGTLNANGYEVTGLSSTGLQLLGDTSITSLSNGYFTQNANNQTLITLASTTLNDNAGLVITDTGFANGGFTGGVNVSLDATTTNSWSFTGAFGNLWGEAFDVDGTDDCSSIRWDDSLCLLTEQAGYRWRNDDGGEGAIDSTWYDTNWSKRQRIRVINTDNRTYTNTAVKFTVPYDADMQSDFDDLRITASDGTTLVNHWTERVQAGSQAVVWLQAPTLATSSVSEFYLYYGNVSATSTSNPDAVFSLVEDFEDDNLTPYGGDTGLFDIDTTYAYGGSLGLDVGTNVNARATDGIGRDDITVSQGQNIRYMQYIDTSASGANDEVCTLFAVQDPVTDNNNYAICVEQPGTDRISIVRDVSDTEFSGTILASSTATFSTGWYEFLIDWKTDNTIKVTMYDASGNFVATASASDSTYTTGGIGFTFWFQHGGWDSYVAWPRTNTLPTVYLGNEQVDGGATWAAPQNTPTGGFVFGETARLRIGIENSGLDIENQNFRLEFAPKLAAPSCQAVPSGNFTAVPNVASCGSSAVCMDTSTNVSDGDPTTDHLLTDAGDFAAGEIVTSPSNQTANFDLNQDRYSEFEYAISLTANAVNDAYCFRVTDGGTLLDSYANLPELTLAFDPVLDPIALNDGLDIVLTAGTTTTIIASTTVTDLNGVADLASATTTFYKTSAGAACTADDNNCYIATSTCAFTNCTATACTLTCAAPLAYHTDPTDLDGGQEWFAFMEVSDLSGASDFGTSPGVELLTLRAMDVQNAIAYGTVDINQNTGTNNPDVILSNIGNESIDVQISGTDMTDGVTSVIPAGQQRFSTSTFDYAACVGCSTLTVTPATVEVDLNKPTSTTPGVADTIYWGIEVPFGTASNPHTGTNFFTAVAD